MADNLRKQQGTTEDLLQALAIAERRRRDTQRLSGVGFWELEHPNGPLYWSEEIFAIYGLSNKTKVPDYQLWLSLIYEEDKSYVQDVFENSVQTGQEYNIRYRIKAIDSVKWIEARGITYYDNYGKPIRTIGTAQDISEIKAAQEKIEHLAYHDMLTDLPNRKLFSDTLKASLAQAQQHNKNLAVLFIDLDNFKLINDKYGHDIGDEILVAVAKNLQHCAKPGELFARIGGDEFAGVLFGDDEVGIQLSIRAVKKAIDTVYKTRIHSFKISASIGVTIFPQDNVDTDILLRHADQAMYEAKEEGKSGIRYFDTSRFQSIAARRHLLGDIKKALLDDEFQLFYQPRIRLSDGHLAGAEALLRWFRPQGAVPPCDIVAAIKNTPEEWLLDTWVIKHVLAHSKIFKELGLKGPFSLNINPSSIVNPDFPKLLETLLSKTGVSGTDIEIEILEVESIENFDVAQNILQQCQSLGVTFSLDDFGTGYSSLTHFHALPVSKLKIDQRFIKRIHVDPQSLTLVKSILAIASTNDKPVVAEGIESDSIADALIELKCEFGQGYGIAKPMTQGDYISWAKNWNGLIQE